jgi:hypothetical protein
MPNQYRTENQSKPGETGWNGSSLSMLRIGKTPALIALVSRNILQREP